MAIQQFVNMAKYWQEKSIKLSDAFEVVIKLKPNSSFEPFVNCVGFTIPKLGYDEETYEYGNVSQVLLTPKYDSCKELTLEFMEHMTDNSYSCSIDKVFEYMGYKVTQSYATNGLEFNKATYNIDKMIPVINIKVLDNRLWKYIYQYHFENLKIINYSIYSLDYQNESPCKISVTFSFETYRKEILNEPVAYPTQEKPIKESNPRTTKDPAGKVKVEESESTIVAEDGKSISMDTELFKANLKESINNEDLAMIKSDPLYQPAFNELMGFDLDSDDIEPELRTEMYKQSLNESDLQMASNYSSPYSKELQELEMMDLEDSSDSRPDLRT